jgi:hypothetical protein
VPIRPENRALYPPRKVWLGIRAEILERAGGRCEGSPGFYPDCRAANGQPHPVTGSLVVLTIAHLNHDPTDNGQPGARPMLKAMCQRCHLTYDARHHAANAQVTRRARLAIGDLFLEELS